MAYFPIPNPLYTKYTPGSKLLILRMVVPPLIGNPFNGYMKPNSGVDDYPLSYAETYDLFPESALCENCVHHSDITPHEVL